MLVHKTTDKLYYAPISGLSQDGGGGGRGGSTHGKFAISGFQMSISPPLGLHFESNSHPWGELVVTHDGLSCSTERLQRGYEQTLCISPSVEDIF